MLVFCCYAVLLFCCVSLWVSALMKASVVQHVGQSLGSVCRVGLEAFVLQVICKVSCEGSSGQRGLTAEHANSKGLEYDERFDSKGIEVC